MNKSQKNIILIVAVLLILFAMLALGVFNPKEKAGPIAVTPTPTTPNPTQNKPIVPNGKCGFTVTSHSVNDRVNFPLTINGTIDNTNMKALGCSWMMFEGQAGSARLYLYDQETATWKALGDSVPVPVPNWMTTKTTFSVTLSGANIPATTPAGTPLKVIFTEDNASGLPPIDTYELPLIFDPNAGPSEGPMALPLYVQDKQAAAQNDCTVTYKAIFYVPKTTAVADASLKILFGDELKDYGTYKSVSVSSGIAKVMLTSNKTPTGSPISSLSSCQSGHLRAVLEDTLTQYPSITKVELHSPQGKIEF